MNEANAHPVWLMLVRSEMIRFRLKKHLIHMALPEDTKNEEEMDAYGRTYGKIVFKEYKVRYSRCFQDTNR